MKRHGPTSSKAFRLLLGLTVLLPVSSARSLVAIQPQPAASAGFDRYVQTVELRLAQQHQSQAGFLAGPNSDNETRARARHGEFIIEELRSGSDSNLPGAMLHHWRGTAFVPGARITDFELLMKDFNAYPRDFAPDIVRARLLGEQNEQGVDRISASIRVRQKHVLTVVLDLAYDLAFVRLDAEHGYSVARSTRIGEIDSPGTSKEHVMSSEEEHGFLWRLNTYWTYEQADGGLYMQIESASLTRSIPTGLAWAIKPFVTSVPRESLEFTLRSACNALRR